MLYPQREPEPAQGGNADRNARRPWTPAESRLATGEIEVGDDDRYVAIDRIDDSLVTLAVADWPTVDPLTGRLDFGDRDLRRTVIAELNELQARVDADRAAAGDLVRPLRVSDVFLIRGLRGGPANWERIVDVTRAGRLAAKAALFATASGAPTADQLTDYGLDPEIAEDRGPAAGGEAIPGAAGSAAQREGEGPPPGPVAYPSV